MLNFTILVIDWRKMVLFKWIVNYQKRLLHWLSQLYLLVLDSQLNNILRFSHLQVWRPLLDHLSLSRSLHLQSKIQFWYGRCRLVMQGSRKIRYLSRVGLHQSCSCMYLCKSLKSKHRGRVLFLIYELGRWINQSDHVRKF